MRVPLFKTKAIVTTSVIWLLLSVTTVYGQILNVEKQRSSGIDSAQWLGNVDFSFSLKEQQTKTLSANLNTNLVYFSSKHSYILIGKLSSLRGNGESLVSHGYGHVRVNFFRKKKLSYELFSQIQYDEVRGMKQRNLIGGNIRYTLKDKDNYLLSIGTGVMYEREQWEWNVTEDDLNEAEGFTQIGLIKPLTEAPKNNTYISLKYDISKNMYLNFITYYQAKFDQLNKPRISGEAKFNVIISKRLRFVASGTWWHDAAPVVPIDKTNYAITNGLKYSF